MLTRSDRVAVIGLGVVGLSTAVCLASKGMEVVGVDSDSEKVDLIARGKPIYFENGLKEHLAKALVRKRFRVSTSFDEASESAVIFVAVGTPSRPSGSIDLAYVKSASRSLGRLLKNTNHYQLIVVKSTVIPGTTTSVVRKALETGSGKKLGEFGLVANPEFLREGHAIDDTLHPDRLVLGTEDGRSRAAMISFYRRFYRKLPKVIATTTSNAELIKYASNSFLATKISFINEIANLCAAIPGADVNVVAEGMGLDVRIGGKFLRAGLGYGGSCLPKDVRALVEDATKKGVNLTVVTAAQEANSRQALFAADAAERLIGPLRGKRIALLGLAFKSESDDMREAVSIRVVDELVKRGATVVGYDPVAMRNAIEVFGGRISLVPSALECVRGSDCCIIATEWPEFARLTPRQFKLSMKDPAVVDGRRVLDPRKFINSGIKFDAVGLHPGDTLVEEQH